MKKNGKRQLKQRFLCKECWSVWELWTVQKWKKPTDWELLEQYVRNEVKFRQMSQMYWVSIRTVRERMDDVNFDKQYCDNITPWKIILLIDTTYYWRACWYMIFRAWYPDKATWKNLLRYKVPYETNEKYFEGYQFLSNEWRDIQAVVCDWRQGLLWWFWSIPTQLCLHHMKQIIIRLLTKKPKLEQTKVLKEIAMCIGTYPKDDIQLAFDVWYEDTKERLWEKNENGGRKHERARKAYTCIKRKLTYCYTFTQYSNLNIPNTTNSLESINGHLKSKVTIHRWMKENNKDKFTNYYLYHS